MHISELDDLRPSISPTETAQLSLEYELALCAQGKGEEWMGSLGVTEVRRRPWGALGMSWSLVTYGGLYEDVWV